MVDNDEADKSISKTGDQADGLGKKFGKGIKTAGKWALGIGAAAVAVGTAAFVATKKVTEGFDAIAKNSRKMGVSTDYYQEMEYWASQNGLSHDNMEKSMKRLNQRLGQAVEGNEKYSGALTRLGVDMEGVKNGTISTEEAMTTSIQALSQMENSQEKAALASELFGTKLAQELMPAIDAGALSIEDAQKKAEELGIVIGEDSLNAAEAFNDSWDDITRSLTAVGQKVFAELIPIFQVMMDWVLAHMPQIQAVFQAVFDVIGIVFGTAIDWIQSLIAFLGEWRSNNDETMTGIWTTIQEVFTQIVEFLQTAWEMIKTFWQENGQAILDYAVFYFHQVWETIKTVFDAVWLIIQEVIGLIVPFIQEQLAKIQQFWEENGEQIMKAVDNAFKFIKGVIDFIMPILVAIIDGAWKIISAVFRTAIEIIMGLVKFFASLLTGDFEGVKKALIDIWNALWDGIKGIVEGAWSLLTGAFSALWDNISGWFTGIADDAVDWGKNMISGFIDGIKAMGSKVADAAKGVISEAGDFLKFWSPAKKGEGRYIRHWGRNMISGFLDGVEDEEGSAGRAMNRVVNAMNPNALESRLISSGVKSKGIADTMGGTNDNQPIVIHITNVNELDGRELSRGTYKHTTDFQKQDKNELEILMGR